MGKIFPLLSAVLNEYYVCKAGRYGSHKKSLHFSMQTLNRTGFKRAERSNRSGFDPKTLQIPGLKKQAN